MATLTAEMQVVQGNFEYVRCRVNVYLTGAAESGEFDITLRNWDKTTVYSATGQFSSQSGGTTQIYTGLHNFKAQDPGRNIGQVGTGLVGVECSAAGANLDKLFGFGSGPRIIPYGLEFEAGETLRFYVVGGITTNGGYIQLQIRDSSGEDWYWVLRSQNSTGTHPFDGPISDGEYQWTIPAGIVEYFTDAEKTTGTTSYNIPAGKNLSGFSVNSTLAAEVFPVVIKVPESYVPEVGDIQYKDGNGYGAPNDGAVDAFVQRLTNVNAWATAEATGGARICKVMCTYGTLSASMGAIQGPAITMPTASSPLVLGTINETGDLTMTLTVEDSRKRRTTKTVTLKTAAYDYPTVSSIDIERWDTTENHSDDESTTVRVHVVGTFTDVNGKGNTGYIKVYADEAVASPDFQLKSTTELEAPAFDKSIDHTGFAETQAWRFKWEVADRFGQMLSGEVLIYGARPTIDVSPDGQSIGFWTTAGGREDVNGNPVNGFYLNGDLTLQEGRAIYGTGGEQENRMDVDKILEFAYNYSTQKFQLDALQNVALANDRYLAGYNAAGSLIRLLGVNASGNVELNWTSGGLGGRVLKRLWSGTLSEGGSVTVSELPYYNIFVIVSSASIGIGVRHFMNNPAYISVALRNYGTGDGVNSENHNGLWLVFSGTTAKLEHSRLFNPITNAYINGNPSVSAIYGVL